MCILKSSTCPQTPRFIRAVPLFRTVLSRVIAEPVAFVCQKGDIFISLRLTKVYSFILQYQSGFGKQKPLLEHLFLEKFSGNKEAVNAFQFLCVK